MQVLDGQAVSEHLRTQLKVKAEELFKRLGRRPQLTVLLVGDDKASEIYVRNKHLACQKIGLDSQILHFPASISQTALLQEVRQLNQNPNVDGVLIQMPLPKGLDSHLILEALDPAKDADGLTSTQLGRLFTGRPQVPPCTPAGVMEILKHYQIPLAGLSAVVVGRSQIVGNPMAQLLLQADASVTVLHSKSKNRQEFLKKADLVVVAAGHRGLLGPEDFKQGAVVVDVGIHRSSEQGKKLFGDVAVERDGHKIENVVKAMTPVPGGVGPMTITMLLANTLKLAELRAQKEA